MAEPLYFLTDERVDAFCRSKLAAGVSAASVAKYKNAFTSLQRWLGDDRALTAARLQAWRQWLTDSGCSKNTVQNYVKHVNAYLRAGGCAELCIPKPPRYPLQGMTFGYLTVLEPTPNRNRRDLLWRCRCRCGREAEFLTARLISGNARSCGHCSRADQLRYRRRIVEETSICKALEEDAISAHSASGYTGVYRKKDKWIAVIVYKKKRYYLGTYDKLEDAAGARALAKERIMADGERMERAYAHLFAQKPALPAPEPVPEKPEPERRHKNRPDNTSGYRGVSRHREKWYAKINHNGVRYHLGTYASLEEAVRARRMAEECVRNGEMEKLQALHTGAAG